MSAAVKEEFEYKAEMKQLLHLIIHSLYTHPEIFLRELISNASDALNKVRFLELTNKNILDAGEEFRIRISVDEKKKTFSIEDNGIGMTREELIQNIGTIAKSGTLEFFQKMKTEQKTLDGNLIGQFGVGFYSVFMVTDQVILETRHASENAQGLRWISDGAGKYTVEETNLKSRGTKITFILKDKYKHFSEKESVKDIIQKYSNFAQFPIYLEDEKINQIQALWHKKTSEIQENDAGEFYKFISNDYENPLGFFQTSMEGTVNFKALIFFPKRAPYSFHQYRDEKSLRLHVNKIMIQEDSKELLPEYLRFVKGVVDTEDLPLNVSREVVQSSPVLAKIKKNLTGKILGFLENWAKNEPEKYQEFYEKFSPLLKTGIESDFENKEKLTELLRFESSTLEKGKFTSLKEYVSRMKEDQKEIYYLGGENRELLEKNPNLEYFKKHEIEVLYLTDPVDVFIIPYVPEYDKKAVKSVDKAELDSINTKEPKIETPESKMDGDLLGLFKKFLGDKVEDVVASKRLVQSPATLVSGKSGMDSQTERMFRMMQKDFTGSKKVLELNMAHPILKNLSRLYLANAQESIIEKAVFQLYEGALLQEGSLSSPADFISRMHEILEKATQPL